MIKNKVNKERNAAFHTFQVSPFLKVTLVTTNISKKLLHLEVTLVTTNVSK